MKLKYRKSWIYPRLEWYLDLPVLLESNAQLAESNILLLEVISDVLRTKTMNQWVCPKFPPSSKRIYMT